MDKEREAQPAFLHDYSSDELDKLAAEAGVLEISTSPDERSVTVYNRRDALLIMDRLGIVKLRRDDEGQVILEDGQLRIDHSYEPDPSDFRWLRFQRPSYKDYGSPYSAFPLRFQVGDRETPWQFYCNDTIPEPGTNQVFQEILKNRGANS